MRGFALALALVALAFLALGGNIGGANAFVYGIRVLKAEDTPPQVGGRAAPHQVAMQNRVNANLEARAFPDDVRAPVDLAAQGVSCRRAATAGLARRGCGTVAGMHPPRVASAAWVFASSPSKVPFYIAGGLLAGWAVLVAAWGITHHEFPRSVGRARLVMLTSATLVAATIAMAIVTAGGPAEESEETAAGPAPTSRTLGLTADSSGEPAYDKKRAAVRAGKVEIRFTNRSSVPHNVTIAKGSEVVKATKTITSGTTATTVNLRRGDYVYFCSVDAHRKSGMEGTLNVG